MIAKQIVQNLSVEAKALVAEVVVTDEESKENDSPSLWRHFVDFLMVRTRTTTNDLDFDSWHRLEHRKEYGQPSPARMNFQRLI